MKPFALEIYERYRSGETIPQLAQRLGIPQPRIEQRIRVAAALEADRVQATWRPSRRRSPAPATR